MTDKHIVEDYTNLEKLIADRNLTAPQYNNQSIENNRTIYFKSIEGNIKTKLPPMPIITTQSESYKRHKHLKQKLRETVETVNRLRKEKEMKLKKTFKTTNSDDDKSKDNGIIKDKRGVYIQEIKSKVDHITGKGIDVSKLHPNNLSSKMVSL